MIYRIFSSLPSFKTLEFKAGLNVLIAKKAPGATERQTRNRAGKTSLIEIIHFLIGADVGKDSLFRQTVLFPESFGMEFDLTEKWTTVKRSGQKKSKVSIVKSTGNSSLISNSEWIELLGETMFGIKESEESGRSPKFRSLFAYFVRRQLAGAFTTPEKQATMQQPGDYQLALMYLLGLDWRIERDWQIVRDRENTLTELKKAVKTGAFGSIIGKSADLRTQLTVAEDRLIKLKGQVEIFKVLP